MQSVFRDTAVSGGSFGFTAANQAFNMLYFIRVFLCRFFFIQELFDPRKHGLGLLLLHVKHLVVIRNKVHKADYIIIKYGDIAGGLVGHVHLMVVFHKANKRAAHRNNIVIRVRTKDNNPFGEGLGTFGTVDIFGIGFAARPSGDGVLQLIKNL